MLTRTFGATLILTMMTAPCLSEDIPYAGIAYNTKEDNAVTYQCVQSGDLLNCEFVQTRVRRKADPNDLRKVLAEAMKQYPAEKKQIQSSQLCKDIDKIIAVLGGTLPSDEMTETMVKDLGEMTPKKKSDATATYNSLKTLCDNPTEANFVDMVEQSHHLQTRTCIVSSNPYKQQFRKVGGSDVWVVAQDGPEGECGIVNVSRFEKDKSSKYALWNYFGKKVITNKSGTLALGMKCSDLDEGEYEFSWNRRTIQLSCDYTEFGVF